MVGPSFFLPKLKFDLGVSWTIVFDSSTIGLAVVVAVFKTPVLTAFFFLGNVFVVVADDVTTALDNSTIDAQYISSHITSCGAIVIQDAQV